MKPPILLYLLVSLSLAVAPSIARAQQPGGTDLAVRLELLRQAQSASTAGDHARALDLADRAGRIQMTTSLRAFTADQQNALGRFGEAYGNAQACAREAETNSALTDRQVILTTCRDLARQLESRIAHITVRVPNPPSGLHVTIAGHDLPDSFLGIPYIVTPGRVRIAITAPGDLPFERDVDVAAGANAEIDAAMTATPAPETRRASSETPRPVATSHPPSVAGPAAVMVIGALGLVTAAVLGVLADGAFTQFEHDQCMAPALTDCRDSAAARGQLSSAGALDTGTEIAAAAGGAIVVIGAIWLIASRSGSSGHRDSAHAFVVPALGGATVGMEGRF